MNSLTVKIILLAIASAAIGGLIVIAPFVTLAMFFVFFISALILRKPDNMLWVAIAATPFSNTVILEILGTDIRLTQFFWMLCVVLYLAKSAVLKKVNFNFQFIIWALLIYNIFNFISIFQSVDARRSLIDSFQFFGLTLIFILLANQLKTEKDVLFSVKILIISGIIFILSGVFQYFSGFSLLPQVIIGTNGVSLSFQSKILEYSSNQGSHIRMSSLYYGVVATGCYTAQLLLLLLWGRKFFDGQKRFSSIILFMIPFAIFLLLMTYSRSSIIAFIATILAIGMYVKKYRKHSFYILLVILPLVLAGPAYERLTTSFNVHESTNPQHLIIYLRTIELFLERPLTGWGCGTSEALIGAGGYYQIFGLKAYLSEKMAVHNWFLQTAAESGLFALSGLLAFVGIFLIKASVSLRKNIIIPPVLLGLISASFCGFLVIQISNFFFREAFWVFLGITWAAINLNSFSIAKK